MTRYVIGADVAFRLAAEAAAASGEHQLVAPTLLRSQLLAQLYEAVRRGELTKKEADGRLDYVRSLRVRLLGDQLQADAFVTLDAALARAVRRLVPVAPYDALT